MAILSSPDEFSLPRRNCVDTPHEHWRPPAFRDRDSLPARSVEHARRFLDLQYQSIYRDIRALAPAITGAVLDVGCGAQPYRHLLGQRCTYRGIDMAAAGDHFGYVVPDTTYFEGDTWPVPGASVDFILSTETLEHVLEPSRFLSEAFRCVRPGGHLILTVPFSARWHYIPHDYWRFTPSSLQWMLANAGFERIKVHARGNVVTVAAYKVMGLVLAASVGKRPFLQDFGTARALGIMALPLLPFLAILGGLSLLGNGGDDCLGYTVIARRPSGDQV